MGTHPIFESDFDCLTVQSNVRLPKERSQQECNAGPEFKVDIERVEVRGCFVGSGSQCRRPNQERLGPSGYLHDAVHYSVSDKAKCSHPRLCSLALAIIADIFIGKINDKFFA